MNAIAAAPPAPPAPAAAAGKSAATMQPTTTHVETAFVPSIGATAEALRNLFLEGDRHSQVNSIRGGASPGSCFRTLQHAAIEPYYQVLKRNYPNLRLMLSDALDRSSYPLLIAALLLGSDRLESLLQDISEGDRLKINRLIFLAQNDPEFTHLWRDPS